MAARDWRQAVSPGGQEISFGARIRELAEDDPRRPQVTVVAPNGDETVLSAGELHVRSNQLARALEARGVGVGDRVGLELRNSPELVLSVLAAWKLGAAPVPMRWDLPAWERDRVAEVLAARYLVREGDCELFDHAAGLDAGELPDRVAPSIGGICSSGSTGTPKIIMDDTPGLIGADFGTPFPAAWGVAIDTQRILVPTALYHTNGYAAFSNFLVGDAIVILEKFDAALVVELVKRHQITTFTATPTMLQRIARVPGLSRADLASVVWIQEGAAVLPPALARTWIDLVGGERLYMAYGMTERLGLTAIRGDEWLAHPGSVGRGFRETDLRILDGDQRELPPGEVGEIYLRSPTTGRYAYLGGSALPMTADGFATCGDLGWMDEDGYLFIADRRVDMIVTGGANVFPAEVETALSEHPDVADAVVLGLPDPNWGRRVHAIVEPADPSAPPTAAAIRAFLRDRLASYKVPKTVEVVDVIPRSAATKVNRGQLAAERGG